jgi:hypothetical protein
MDMNKVGFQISPEEVFKSSKSLEYFPVDMKTWAPKLDEQKIRLTTATDMFKVS